jgi:ribosomal protein S18 acetylase RimI-like enzyme
MTEPTPEPARTDELAAAFRLIFHSLGPKEAGVRVANALHLVQRGEIDPRGVFVLRGPTGLLGALVCLPVPGASGLLWPPGTVDDDRRREREDLLLQHTLAWLRQRGVKLAQTLLAPEEMFLARPLERNGLAHVTDLWYMRHDLDIPVRWLDTPARLTFRPYDPDHPSLFHQTLQHTYEQTRDCPEVNGVRTIEDVIEGHRNQGTYDPDCWWLASLSGEPVGVAIVTELPERGDWEVAYMGVVPEARRRGFGREILLKALTEARAAEVPRLTLSVDSRNQPAWDLYRSLGFEPFDRRAVYLLVWR